MSQPNVTFPIDQARIADARHAYRLLQIWQIVLAGLALGGLILTFIWKLHLLTWILAGALFVLSIVSIVLAMRRWRSMRSLASDGRGIALAIDDNGIALAGLPSIPWSEVIGVATIDDRERTQRAMSKPLRGVLGNLSLRAGNSVLSGCVLVRDGDALRAACSSEEERARINVWKPHPSDGKPHGSVTLKFDALMREQAALQAGQALVTAARARSIDAEAFTSAFPFMEFMGERVDPKWK